MQRILQLVDDNGKTIELSVEQLLLLEQLSHEGDYKEWTDKEKDLLNSLDFDELQNLDPKYINQIID